MSQVPAIDALFDQLEAAIRAYRERWDAHAAFVEGGGLYDVPDPIGVPRGMSPQPGAVVDPNQHVDRVHDPNWRTHVEAKLHPCDDELRDLLGRVETYSGRLPSVPEGA